MRKFSVLSQYSSKSFITSITALWEIEWEAKIFGWGQISACPLWDRPSLGDRHRIFPRDPRIFANQMFISICKDIDIDYSDFNVLRSEFFSPFWCFQRFVRGFPGRHERSWIPVGPIDSEVSTDWFPHEMGGFHRRQAIQSFLTPRPLGVRNDSQQWNKQSTRLQSQSWLNLPSVV